MRKNSGFTAFELAITMAIMVVIAAFVLPSYLNWLRGYRLSTATSNLMSDLELAKVRAIRENAVVTVDFEESRYQVIVNKGTADEATIRNRSLPAGVRVDVALLTFPDTANEARFNGRGLPVGLTTEQIISLTNSSGRKNLVLNRLGHMKVQ